MARHVSTGRGICFVLFRFLSSCFSQIPFIVVALLSLSLSLSRFLPVITQIQGHIVGPPPPSPLRYVFSLLSREEFSIFFPRRLASKCVPTRAARRSQQLIFIFLHFCQYFQNLTTVGIELKDQRQ